MALEPLSNCGTSPTSLSINLQLVSTHKPLPGCLTSVSNTRSLWKDSRRSLSCSSITLHAVIFFLLACGRYSHSKGGRIKMHSYYQCIKQEMWNRGQHYDSWSSCLLKYEHPIWATVCVPADPLPILLPVNRLGKALENGPNVWAPATGMGDQHGVPGYWFRLAQPFEFILGMSHWMEHLFLWLSLSL